MLQPTTGELGAAYPPRERWVYDAAAYSHGHLMLHTERPALAQQATTSSTHLLRGGYGDKPLVLAGRLHHQ